MTDRELIQQALDALEDLHRTGDTQVFDMCHAPKLLPALRARLAQPEPEPVAWADKYDLDREGHDFWVSRQQPAKNGVPLYTAPPQREWQTLTENEIKHLWYEACQTNLELTSQLIVHLARDIEAKLKEKNT